MANAVGRPLKFKTPEELQTAIDEYFAWCDARTIKKVDDNGKEYLVSYPAPYTMHGLARALQVDRQTILNYADKDEYFGAIKAARQRVAEDVETRLMDGKAQTGAIFNLKNNFGWKDETHTDLTTGGEPFLFTRGEK